MQIISLEDEIAGVNLLLVKWVFIAVFFLIILHQGIAKMGCESLFIQPEQGCLMSFWLKAFWRRRTARKESMELKTHSNRFRVNEVQIDFKEKFFF